MKNIWGLGARAAALAVLASSLASCIHNPYALSSPWSLTGGASNIHRASAPAARDSGDEYLHQDEYRPILAAERQSRDPFADIARELLASIETGKRIALQPYAAAEVPVPVVVAQSFNDSLARAIEKAASGNVIVARGELPTLLAEQEEFGQTADQIALLEGSRADILLIGALLPVRGGVEISYKAFDLRTGRQVSSSQPRFLPVDTSAASGMSLEQALASAADALAKQIPDMKSVETLGIYYQQSDVQTSLGSYIGKELTGRLVERISGLQAMPAAILAPELQSVEQLEKGGTEEVMLRTKPGTFLLSGTLWDFGPDVEVRLSLKGDGRAASHGVRIRRDSLPRSLLPIAPAGGVLDRRESAGPFGIQLSSDRGRRPVYAVGDAANLVVQTARDGYLYCFHKASERAGGRITKIFPNSFHRDARVRGLASVHIPGEDMNFAFRVEGPAGVEYVRCFALDRDAGGSLPADFAGGDLAPVGLYSLDDLSRIFRTLPAAQMSEATMVMTIESQR
ncbi:MAG: DUF4384 domain-containing protein [Rhodospirillaceae bacterium]